MNCQILYFATLQTEADKTQENFSIIENSAQTCADVYQTLKKRYQFSLSTEQLRVAKNHSFCEWHDEISAGDTIAFIPPVSGG